MGFYRRDARIEIMFYVSGDVCGGLIEWYQNICEHLTDAPGHRN